MIHYWIRSKWKSLNFKFLLKFFNLLLILVTTSNSESFFYTLLPIQFIFIVTDMNKCVDKFSICWKNNLSEILNKSSLNYRQQIHFRLLNDELQTMKNHVILNLAHYRVYWAYEPGVKRLNLGIHYNSIRKIVLYLI